MYSFSNSGDRTLTQLAKESHGGGLRILALVTDAHGGFAGISQYNRDALEAMSGYRTVKEVHVIPRIAPLPIGHLPEKVHYHLGGLKSLTGYLMSAFRCGMSLDADIIYCAHINLAPVAIAIATLRRAPLVLAIYGVDAWQAVKRTPKRTLAKSVSAVVSISEVTRDRFLSWCPVPANRMFLVPNAIRPESYGEGAKNATLLERYRLQGKTVLMTLGRMASDEQKGFERVIEVLPRLVEDVPNVVYLAVGDGTDRRRLEAKVAMLNLQDRVIFTGRVEDRTKAEFYRLADVYVMPSLGEGFGFVVLEALASGVPVVVSSKDGTREAVRSGELGIIVDPDDLDGVRRGILDALQRPRGVPPGLSYFSFDNFSERLRAALGSICQV
jgi:phosphatidylinositol alpha-1,6-mannosyltransferase